jgi:hypothetical protein
VIGTQAATTTINVMSKALPKNLKTTLDDCSIPSLLSY